MRAPCGHPGEPVIGAYVRCSWGCSDDPFKDPVARINEKRRGVDGHVAACACPACVNCRRIAWFATRTKDGADSVKLYWGGKAESSDSVVLQMYLPDAKVRHLNAVDADGKVIASHPVHIDAKAGDHLQITFSPTTLVISTKHWGVARYGYDLSKIQVSKKEMESWHTLYERVSPEPKLGWLDYTYGTIRGTAEDIQAAACSVQGVEYVECSSPEPGVVRVVIKRTADDCAPAVRNAVRVAVLRVVSAGTGVRVELATPQYHLQEACMQARTMLIMLHGRNRPSADTLVKRAARMIYRKLRKHGYKREQIGGWIALEGLYRINVTLRVDRKKYGYSFACYA